MTCDGNHDGGGSTILAFLLGGCVGGILGILYAPSSGEETRRRLKFYAEETADKVVERVQQVREETDAAVKKVSGELKTQKEKIRSALDAGKNAFKQEKEALEENA